ncbi:Tripartite tricarboxylate transporter TctB family protein [Caballeronia udeis]|uniref:Tripartite tricarboxylate transporter TctB family protein n=1 Tax=Caballeronia udeis TaxID=1232866 RepID=A0A158I4G8_9BURK|nr:tripartite tricarboxylate transporter TctB family protein [Caballeronia udeis]SAL51464.1 Tripartite tricarboxylate transporter TctB family protein [Caballeronia udeis]
MVLRFANDKTLLSGIVFGLIGTAVLCLDRNYELGSATAMGPGYFPMLIGVLLVALGLANVVIALKARSPSRLDQPALRALLMIALGVLLFGVVIDRFGLLPAILALVACASLTGARYRLWEVVVIFAILSMIAGGLFVYGLGLPASYLVRF